MKTFIMPLKDYLIKIDGAPPREKKPFKIESDGEYFFEFISLNDFDESDGLYYPSFAARLSVKNGAPSYIPDRLCAAEYKNAVELFAVPRAFRPFRRETTLCECRFSAQNRRYRAAVLCGAETVLSIDCIDASADEKNVCRESLPLGLKSAEVAAAALGKRQYLTVKGDLRGRAYLFIAEFSGGGLSVLFEEEADAIETETQTVSVTKKFADMLKRGRTEKYIFGGGAAELCGAEFFYGAADVKYKDELLPYLFLEALGAGDLSCAEKYLAADLRENLPEISEFFGNFYSVEGAKHSDFGIDTAALKYRGEKNITVKYYSFALENGIIKNFGES
ncbi:MAG: hypothetical protein LBP62_06330 [Clostridiales bacterium]|jgi:hypothetical protein|nr:hypothetical protein [Clostridiales bacterium]